MVLIYFIRRRRDLPFPGIFWLFGAFILGCGTTHLMEIIVTDVPVYRLAALVKVFTAVVSVATVFALVRIAPLVLVLSNPLELQHEVDLRRTAEERLRQANLGLQQDVKERTDEVVSLNAALRLSEGQLRHMADAMPQMVWVARVDGYHEYFNRRWYEFTALREKDAGGWQWSSSLHDDDRELVEPRWRHSLVTGEPFEIDCRLRRGDGTYRWFLARALPVRDERGQVVRWFGTCTDIDDKKHVEEELERRVAERTTELAVLNEALRRSNSSLEEFAYVASHDLQEPLRKIQSFSDRLKSRCAEQLDDQACEYLERMSGSAARMQRLINDLLAFSRVTTSAQPARPVNLSHIAREVVSDLEGRLHETGGQVRIGPLPTVVADATQMRQLLQNLIGNALKFHRDDIEPEVVVTGKTLPRSEESPFPLSEITIRDNGIGFENVYTDRIFQVFQRLHGKHRYEGTGIGLAICRRIVERHGGSITAHGVPGQGATFVVRLPIRPGT